MSIIIFESILWFSLLYLLLGSLHCSADVLNIIPVGSCWKNNQELDIQLRGFYSEKKLSLSITASITRDLTIKDSIQVDMAFSLLPFPSRVFNDFICSMLDCSQRCGEFSYDLDIMALPANTEFEMSVYLNNNKKFCYKYKLADEEMKPYPYQLCSGEDNTEEGMSQIDDNDDNDMGGDDQEDWEDWEDWDDVEDWGDER